MRRKRGRFKGDRIATALHASTALSPPHRNQAPTSEQRVGGDQGVKSPVKAIAYERSQRYRDKRGERSNHCRSHARDVAQGLHGERAEIAEQESDAQEHEQQVGHEQPEWGTPAKAKASIQKMNEANVMDSIAILESRRIPYFITRRPFTSEAAPMESASAPK